MPLDRAHRHTFSKHQTRVDFCHFVLVKRYCKGCEEEIETEVERDFHKNPLQICFARVDCARCRQLCYDIEPPSWHYCSECGCELTEQETGRCAVCYRHAQEALA